MNYDKIPVKKKVVKMLEDYNINKEYTLRCIENNKHNNITTTYYLLL